MIQLSLTHDEAVLVRAALHALSVPDLYQLAKERTVGRTPAEVMAWARNDGAVVLEQLERGLADDKLEGYGEPCDARR